MLFMFLVDLREDQSFNGSDHVFQIDKCHQLVCLSGLHFLRCDHASDCHDGIVLDNGLSVFIDNEIRSSGCHIFLPEILVFFHRMTADINAQRFLFICQQFFFFIFTDRRHRDLKAALLLFTHKIEKAQLTLKTGLLLFRLTFQKIRSNDPFLLSGSRKRIQCTGFDEAL